MSNLGFVLSQQGRYEEVEKLASEALSYFTEVALTEVAGNRVFQQVRAQNTGYLAGARAHRGDHRAANQLLGDMVAQDPSSALTHYNAACVLGNCARAVARDPQLTTLQRKELTGQYTDRAIGYLRRGAELDRAAREYIELIATDKDLDPFRNHSEFKKLMAEIASWPARAPAPREVKR